MNCSCGSELDYENCCEPIISGKIKAQTAEKLMRARFTAYCQKNIDFVEATHDPKTKKDFDRASSEEWAQQTDWLSLKILQVEGGGESEDKGLVEFVAEYESKEGKREHREISTFTKRNSKWYFSDAKAPESQTVVREGEKVGRNDPCPCGSGKKHKKCCG